VSCPCVAPRLCAARLACDFLFLVPHMRENTVGRAFLSGFSDLSASCVVWFTAALVVGAAAGILEMRDAETYLPADQEPIIKTARGFLEQSASTVLEMRVLESATKGALWIRRQFLQTAVAHFVSVTEVESQEYPYMHPTLAKLLADIISKPGKGQRFDPSRFPQAAAAKAQKKAQEKPNETPAAKKTKAAPAPAAHDSSSESSSSDKQKKKKEKTKRKEKKEKDGDKGEKRRKKKQKEDDSKSKKVKT
jgi:hypothetical protein